MANEIHYQHVTPPNCDEDHKWRPVQNGVNKPSSCLEEEKCDALMEDDAEIDYRIAVDGSIVEYRDMVDGFYQTERVAHDVM